MEGVSNTAMREALKLLEAEFLQNSLTDWLLALLIAALTWSVLLMLRRAIAARFANASETPPLPGLENRDGH